MRPILGTEGAAGTFGPPRLFHDRYALQRELGRGATAVVFLAHDRVRDALVAVKVLRRELTNGVSRARFLREADIGRRLDHPNIVRILDFADTGEDLYFTMPFVEGETLRTRLARERQLSIDAAVAITRAISDAVSYAHGQGVIHRDLKPGNILLAGDTVLVADFGIARAMSIAAGEALTESGLAIGTPEYMSPEQGGGQRDLDARSDVYALGCVAYEMLAGEPPFTGPTPQAVIARHCSEPVRSLRIVRPAVGVGLQEAIEKALAKVPADRFQDARAFAQSLEASIANVRSPERRESIAWIARNRMRIGLGTAFFALGYWVMVTTGLISAPLPPFAGNVARDSLTFTVSMRDRSQGDGIEDLVNHVHRSLSRWKDISVTTSRVSRRRAGRGVELAVSTRGASRVLTGTLVDRTTETVLRETSVSLPSDVRLADSAVRALADAMLFEAPPVATDDRDIGTTSVLARRAFLSGRAAVTEWDLTRADTNFRRATQHDPAYTVAFLWLAQVRSWSLAKTEQWAFAADRVMADSGQLVPADRILARALHALATGDRARACGQWRELTALRPRDFAAWYGFGSCLRFDSLVVRSSNSRSGWAFRTSYNLVLDAYDRAFRLLPSLRGSFGRGSFADVRQLLMTNASDARPGRAAFPDTTRFWAQPTWTGDSLSFEPYDGPRFESMRGTVSATARREAIVRGRRRFHGLTTMWRTVFPTSVDALEAVGVALDLLGNGSALDTFRLARRSAVNANDLLRLGTHEIWTQVKLAMPADSSGLVAARALADTLLSTTKASDARAGRALASLAALTGQAALAARYARVAGGAPTALAQSAPALVAFAAMGGPRDSLRALESEVAAAMVAGLSETERTTAYSLWLLRAASLAIPNYVMSHVGAPRSMANPAENLVDAWKQGDAARANRIVDDLRVLRRRRGLQASDVTADALYSEAAALAALGDSRSALIRLREGLDSLRFASPLTLADPSRAGPLIRAAALRAELEARSGDPGQARAWARAIGILWANADEPARSIVQRMAPIAK